MTRNRNFTLALALVAATSVAANACASKAQTGAVVGAGGGAVVGGVIGAATGSTAKGAIIGAAVGGAAGAIIGDQMDRRAREIQDSIPGADVERVGEGILVTFESGLLFPFDSDNLLPNARSNLQTLAGNLQRNRDSDLTIVGHTDAVGNDSYNQALSERRARAAADYLVGQGVDRSRLQTSGRGEMEPVASNDSESGRQDNRRVEVAIYANKALQEQARRQASQSN